MSRLQRALSLLLATVPLRGQDASMGVSIPMTVTFGTFGTNRLATKRPAEDFPLNETKVKPGFRALFYPSLKLGRHWYAFSAVQANSMPFFYYEAYHKLRNPTWSDYVPIRLMQAYVAYERKGESGSITVKTGRLPTAFGAFAHRYDDMTNPLINSPSSYGEYHLLRPDKIPCTVSDFERQPAAHPNISMYRCVGPEGFSWGIFPVTLYGLPGSEVDLTLGRMDARVQVTNSSPANPKSLTARSQHPQLALGAGITIAHGLRVGASGFHGPWLEDDLDRDLPAGARARRSPASAIGIDAQWARQRFSMNAEWQQMVFRYPYYFRKNPAPSFGYSEIKMILTPRLYGAVRAGFERQNQVQDLERLGRDNYLPNKQGYELAIGYRPNRHQLIKIGYLWVKSRPKLAPSESVLGFQLVTSLPGLSKAFR